MDRKFANYQIKAAGRAAIILELYEEDLGFGGMVEERLATVFSDLMAYTDMVGADGKFVSKEAERYYENGKMEP